MSGLACVGGLGDGSVVGLCGRCGVGCLDGCWVVCCVLFLFGLGFSKFFLIVQ